MEAGIVEDGSSIPNGGQVVCYTFETRLSGPDFNSDPLRLDDTNVIEYERDANTSIVPVSTTPNFSDPAFVFVGDPAVYNNLRWRQKTGESTYTNIMTSSLASPEQPTYSELSTVSTSMSYSFSLPLDTADVNVYTYNVWNENLNQISDTTELTLVILRTESIRIDRSRPGDFL